jgi:hypothetical protein
VTPLAHRIVRELTLPEKERSFKDPAGLLPRMDDICCFEMSAVIDLAGQLALNLQNPENLDKRLAFLPAPKTWIEIYTKHNDMTIRTGWLLEQTTDGFARTIVATEGLRENARLFSSLPINFWLPLIGHPDLGHGCAVTGLPPDDDSDAEEHLKSMEIFYAFLALVNTPRIIGRREHKPHTGLRRKLAAARGRRREFRMNPWTEIVLEVTAPRERGHSEGLQETRLTGSRALHFCRKHLRIRNGHVELVRGHWRGDPQIGVKQSQYRVVPSKGEGPRERV